MKTFITSDLHLGHTNIIKYCSRPFKDIEHMNTEIIKRWNERIKPSDTVIHLGDFCFKNTLNGKDGDPKNWWEWRKQLNGQIVFVKGNHDRNNSMKTSITHLLLDYGKRVILCQHHPLEHPKEVPDIVDLILCGHVHEHWFGKMFNGIPMINVGVDKHNFYPWEISELFRWESKLKKGEEI